MLQLRLQQRRTREQLVDQGIMPRKEHHQFFSASENPKSLKMGVITLILMVRVAALKSPAAFHGQIRSLERARVRHPG